MEIITNSQFCIQNLKQTQKRKWNRLYESCCRFYFLIMFQLSAVTKHSHANFCQQQFCTNIKIDDRVSSFRIQIKKTDHKPKNIFSANCKIFCSFINTLKPLDPFGTERKKKVHRFTNNLQGLQKVVVKYLEYYSMKCFTF